MKFAFKILDKKKFILCYIHTLLTNLCFYCTPVLLAHFIKEPFTLEKLGGLIVSIIVTKLLAVVLNEICIMYIFKFENIYSKDLQLAYFNRIVRMKPFQLNKVHNGFLKKQIDIIAEESEEFLEQSLDTFTGVCISIVMFLTQVFYQDMTMFKICLGIIVGMILYNVWLGKKIVGLQEEYNDAYSKYNATFVDFLQNVKTVKKLGASRFANQKNETLFEKVLPKLDRANLFYSFRSNGISFFVYVMYVIVLINLYVKMQAGENVLATLLFYASIFDLLRGELKELGFLFVHFNKFQAATNQVEKMIGQQAQKDLINEWNTIQIRDLTFQYHEDANIKIQIPDFEIKRGEKISIVGKSGQGKSTFLNIFSRYIEVDADKYKIDGKSKEGDLNLAYISQEIDLFDLTIRENLCLGKKISDEDLMEILKEADLQDWVKSLENGLDTVVGERGLKLSVGQKQRLNLIRGILLDKDIYVLDEPTSNLDKETEKWIVHLLEKYLKNKTAVIVTHREELKQICQKHYVFEENRMKKETFQKC